MNDSDSDGVVYFIQAGRHGLIKIGKTKGRVKDRLAQLQTGSAEELRLLITIPGYSKREQELHTRFRHARERGEWFRPSQELLAFIDGISYAGTRRLYGRPSGSPPITLVEPKPMPTAEELESQRECTRKGIASILEALSQTPTRPAVK